MCFLNLFTALAKSCILDLTYNNKSNLTLELIIYDDNDHV
jgi:hypothetical protein